VPEVSYEMKVLLSALSCEPGRGSELEVGFRALLAAATDHEVWAITLSQSVPRVLEAVQGDPRGSRIHLEGIDFGLNEARMDLVPAPVFHWYYDRWQRALSARALELDRSIDFDLVHHVTLASYWTRTGVAVVRKPLVWGPVGGGVNPPRVLIPALGLRGIVESLARAVGRPLMANLPPMRKTPRTAEVILAQNRATARILGKGSKVSLLSNALSVELDALSPAPKRSREVLFVGRLIDWKAPMLALRAFRYVATPGAVLVFCGQGRERSRLERAMRRLRIEDRVRFEGWLPRQQLLSMMSQAGALVHPAVHEEAGLCIAEALSLGTPVVCLNHGGPAEVVRHWPARFSALVTPEEEDATARSMAAGIDRFLSDPPPILSRSQRPALSFREELLSAYESAVSKFGPRDRPAVSERAPSPSFQTKWIGLPNSRSPRWILPKAPGACARGGMFVYHPVTFKGRVGWEIGKLLAGFGVFRFFPSSHPPEDLWEALFPYLPTGSSLALAKTNHPGRYVALGVSAQGDLMLAAKLAKDEAGRAKLRREQEHIETFGRLLSSPIRPPRVLTYEDGILVLEAVTWKPRIAPWHLSEAVAHSLGCFFQRTKRDGPQTMGAAHGDFAPWNLLLGHDGEWTLLDWENASRNALPFFDLFHYLVQSNHELWFPQRRSIVNGLAGRGWIGRAIRAYADGAGIAADPTRQFFLQYLEDTRLSLDPVASRRAVRARQDLAHRLNENSASDLTS
jgi:glycosyltransferase involved in cell wall biosynthesis